MSMGARGASGPRMGLAACAVLAAPVVFRLALLSEQGGGPAAADLRGFFSDAAVSLAILALALALACLSRILALASVAGWVLVQYANLENVRALGAPASIHDLGFLGDRTFLLGSALAVSQPWLLAGVALASLALLWPGLRGARPGHAVRAVVAGAVLLGAGSLWPRAAQVPAWRQTNVLAYNAGLLASDLGARAPAHDFPDPPAAMLDLVPDLAANLDGAPLLPPGPRARNVLLVVLESVSGAYLPTLAEDHGRFGGESVMPRLDAVARSNLAWSSFVVHQRKTNRGLYSLLCGELPNLVPGLPKMSDFVERGWRACLPELLRDAGYRTAYLQAAPLAFMLKDQFMPKIGFDEVAGHDWFERHYALSQWGVDDRAFLEQSVARIAELRAGGKPWFLTLLTVGTHHPFVLPDDFRREGAEWLRALAYLDAAIGAFVDELAASGVLEDTLVLITSDETPGLTSVPNEVMRNLSQNWGFLIALLPQPQRQRISEPFGQMDVALSVLDYLGLADRATHLFGRSVFRRYDTPRYLFFANTNMVTAGALDPEGHLLFCMDNYRSCRRFGLPSGRAFAPGRVLEEWDPEADGIVREMARRSLHAHPEGIGPREFELMINRVFRPRGGERQLVHGGQYVDLRPGEWIDVVLEIEATSESGHTELLHLLRSTNSPPLFQPSFELGPGDVVKLRYSFAPRRPLEGVRVRTLARAKDSDETELNFRVARMRLHDGTGDSPPGAGVVVLQREVVRSGRAGTSPAP